MTYWNVFYYKIYKENNIDFCYSFVHSIFTEQAVPEEVVFRVEVGVEHQPDYYKAMMKAMDIEDEGDDDSGMESDF